MIVSWGVLREVGYATATPPFFSGTGGVRSPYVLVHLYFTNGTDTGANHVVNACAACSYVSCVVSGQFYMVVDAVDNKVGCAILNV